MLHPMRIGIIGGRVHGTATVSNTANAVSITDLTTYTFSSQSLGTASTSRKIVVGATGAATALRAVSTLTVAGNSASLVVAANENGLNFYNSELWQVDVPTGTTGDVVVTWNGGMIRGAIGVWAVYGALSAAHATATDINSSPLSKTLDIPAGGVAIGCALADTNGPGLNTWAGITKGFDVNVETATDISGAQDAFATQQSALTISDTLGAGTEHLFAIASWGPQ